MILEHIDSPADLRSLTPEELDVLSEEIRTSSSTPSPPPVGTSAPTSAWSS
jgi:hypothetical protein